MYVPVTRLHFINQALIFNYDTLLGPGGSDVALEKGLYKGREDGIDSATAEMIRAQKDNDAPTESNYRTIIAVILSALFSHGIINV